MTGHNVRLNLSKEQLSRIRKNRGAKVQVKDSQYDEGSLVNLDPEDFVKLRNASLKGKGARVYVNKTVQDGDGVAADFIKARIPDSGIAVIDDNVDKLVDKATDWAVKKGKKAVKHVAKKTWKGVKKLFGWGADGEPIYIEVDDDGQFEITGKGIKLAGQGIKLAGEGIRLAGEGEKN